MTPTLHDPFPRDWNVELLARAPLIAPARQFVWPRHVAGEEDALNRGAMLLNVAPAAGGSFLATCALGFRDPALPTGVWTCPRRQDLLALAGGYAYLADTHAPETCLHVPLKPVTAVLPAPADGLLLLAGFHHVVAIGSGGIRWTSARLSWEGLTLTEVRDGKLHGAGWNMMTDREVPFELDLASGVHTGGGFP